MLVQCQIAGSNGTCFIAYIFVSAATTLQQAITAIQAQHPSANSFVNMTI